jgi:sulfur-carrier protein
MAVRVRMFAALREAAGTGDTTSDGQTIGAVLADLRARYGEPFGTRLRTASILLDGAPVGGAHETPVPDGAEVVLLPPVSGGAAGPPRLPV